MGKRVKISLFGPASVDSKQRTALPEKAQIQRAAAVQPCSPSPLRKGTCPSLFSPERHSARSLPAAGGGKRKALLLFSPCFSLLTAADHQAADQVREPRWNPSSAGQATFSSRELPLTNFSLSRWEKERERKKERRKKELQTSFENPLVGRAWRTRPGLGDSGILKTRSEQPGGVGHLGWAPTCARPAPVPWVLGVSPEVARTRQDRRFRKPVCVSSGVDSWKAAGAVAAASLYPPPHRIA